MESENNTLLRALVEQVAIMASNQVALIAIVDRLEGKPSTSNDLKPSSDEDLKPSGDEDLKPSSDEDLKPSSDKDLKPSIDEDLKPSGDEPVIPKKAKKLPKKIKKLMLQKEYYTPEEVDKMDNFVLCREFIRLTGRQTLHCCHCGKKETALDNWINSIRKRCLKPAGLSKDIVLPKTCDKKQAVNSICNPINNRVYPVLRSNKTSNEKKERYKYAKKVCFESIGKATKEPYKY
jgi:hypothetical protein